MTFDHALDVVIVGAGPAGLAAAVALKGKVQNLQLIEAGKALHARRHLDVDDIGKGVGGAGLFSDGKFSFFPSGTRLYQLDKELLDRAFQWAYENVFSAVFDESQVQKNIFQCKRSDFDDAPLKKYPSHYVPLMARSQLIERLTTGFGNNILIGTELQELLKTREGYVLRCRRQGRTPVNVLARHVLFATGRHSLMSLASDSSFDVTELLVPKRYEIGVRLETSSGNPFFSKHTEADIKYIVKGQSGVEYRTFCTCRRGEIVNIQSTNLSSISGRTDGTCSDYSNFGFLVRYPVQAFNRGRSVWETFLKNNSARSVVVEPLRSFLGLPVGVPVANCEGRQWKPRKEFMAGSIRGVAGELLHEDLRSGLLSLIQMHPSLNSDDALLLFPAIEGVGYYPETDDCLRVRKEGIWVAGDAVGDFRGLVPALVSGYLAGLSLATCYTKRR